MPVCNKAVFAHRVYPASALATAYRANNHVKRINRVSQGVCIRYWRGIWRFTKSPLLRTNRKPQFIATVFTPIPKRLSIFYCICGILIAVAVVGQLDLVNSFGEADRESYINRATAVTCISPLQLPTNCKKVIPIGVAAIPNLYLCC